MARRRHRGGRVSTISKNVRIVDGGGGGGSVNHCEQVLDDQNNTVTVSGSEQTAASINHRVNPPSSNQLRAPSFLNHKLKGESQNEKNEEVSNEVDFLKQKLAEANEYNIAKLEVVARNKNLDVLPSTQVSSTCSCGIGSYSSWVQMQCQQEQQNIKPEKRRISQAATNHPNPEPLESNQIKQCRTSTTQAKSAKIRTMQECSLITADDAYYTCLRNYDPINDEPVSKNIKSNLEIPSYRLKKYSASFSAKGTEDMSDDVFQKRHYKHELDEKKRKKRDLQQLRESIRLENLKKGRNKHHSQKSNDKNKEELTTLLPSLSDIKAIEITNQLPVSAFGFNLYK